MAEKLKGEDPCWSGYQMVGMKKKDGREVPNCVPKASSAKKKSQNYKKSRVR